MTTTILTQKTKTNNICREICYNDIDIICSWIRNQRMLSLVSGDIGNGLSPIILNSWITNSIRTFVIADSLKNEPLGFCTITTQELSTNPTHIELCHLIVNPHCAKLDIGIELCLSAFKSASNLGFKFIIGRVVLYNYFGFSLARTLNWEKVSNQLLVPQNFSWFIKDLDKIDFLNTSFNEKMV